MGRAKLKMELISNEKARHSTFQKRKKGLMKKAYELSTLCDVHVCLIIYGPNCKQQQVDHPVEPEIWPANPYEIHRMIELYKKRSDQDRTYKTLDLSNFFKDRIKKVEEALMKLRTKNDNEAKYPTWDHRYNNFPEEFLRQLSHILERKLEDAKTRLQFMKGTITTNHRSLEALVPAAAGMVDYNSTQKQHSSYFMQDLFRRNNSMQLKLLHEQQSISDFDLPLQYSIPLDYSNSSSVANPMMMMMMMNDNYCNQLGGMSSSSPSSSNVMYTPMDGGPIYVDPVAAAGGMLAENYMMVNNPNPNPNPSPMHYYSPTMQVMPHYMQYPIMSSASSQVHPTSQMENYYHETKNQK